MTDSPCTSSLTVIPAYRRAALEKWKQNFGSSATYNNLIGVFERAGYSEYASTVRHICGKFLFKRIDLSGYDNIVIPL